MENMRKIGIAAIIIVAALVGYKAVQRYQAKHADVKVQFLNFDSDGYYDHHHHEDSYDRGYDAGYAAALRDSQRDGVRVQFGTEKIGFGSVAKNNGTTRTTKNSN